MTFESSIGLICELVKDFKSSEAKYMSASYQEAEARRDFIDKFFEALGWDVYHRQQKNPYEQEVKVEKGVSVGRAQKRADYAFFISPEFRSPKFFAEAKKPSRNLKNADDYFQTIRYGWNANTPVAVLTDFQELHILDCRIKPNINTVLENPAHKSYYLDDYIDLEKFAEIFYLLSRDAVAGGSLEKYSGSLAKPKGKIKAGTKAVQAIDEDFLEYIDGIRERLARAFKKNDESLSSEELTEATQKTIDRLVFIRFLEDKLIEPQNIISEFGRRGDAFKDFISASGSLDSKYNGIVFKEHFIDKKDFKGPNETEFKKICEEFSHLNSPYDFNAIPVHIIGSIYERFLGKVVNATAHRVKVEEKPEVRKAGGVYYTPKYIVDYIVENTVGKIIRNETSPYPLQRGTGEQNESENIPLRRGIKGEAEIKTEERESISVPLSRGIKGEATGKTPAEISKLRFADIACGSGSFLIGVFETLLKYHTEYYNQNPEQARKDGCIDKDGAYILSIKQKQKILQNNIYGVDIDLQAVEVTQLSLALKMLEDETTATANEMQVLFHERILPDLSKNIVCGNSLIGTDILEGKMFGTDEERKLNPMDFETTFPNVFCHTRPDSHSRLDSHSRPDSHTRPDCHSRENGNPLETGGFDAIVGNPPYVRPHNIDITSKEYFWKYYISFKAKSDLYCVFIEKVIRLLKLKGFMGYIVSSTWLGLESFYELRNILLQNKINKLFYPKPKIFKGATVETTILLLEKIYIKNNIIKIVDFNTLESINEIEQNLFNDTHNKIFDLSYKKNIINVSNFYSAKFEKLKSIVDFLYGLKTADDEKFLTYKKINNEYKPLLRRSDFSRYLTIYKGEYVWYRPDLMRKNKNTARPGEPDRFEKPKIIIADIARKIVAQLELEKYYIKDALILLKNENNDLSLKFIIGILNSKLITYIYSKSFLGLSVAKNAILELPIPKINFQSVTEKQAHDKIVSLVEQMLEAKKQLHGSKTEKDKIYFERKCDSLDKQIDAEVYKLYGLTEDEIKIINES